MFCRGCWRDNIILGPEFIDSVILIESAIFCINDFTTGTSAQGGRGGSRYQIAGRQPDSVGINYAPLVAICSGCDIVVNRSGSGINRNGAIVIRPNSSHSGGSNDVTVGQDSSACRRTLKVKNSRSRSRRDGSCGQIKILPHGCQPMVVGLIGSAAKINRNGSALQGDVSR